MTPIPETKALGMFASLLPPNNDWIISPKYNWAAVVINSAFMQKQPI
jgi:hypothetical protein